MHPSEEDLELYALGRLVSLKSEAVEEHLLVCGTCHCRLDEIARLALDFRAQLSRPETQIFAFPAFLKQHAFALAAGLAAIAVTAGLYFSAGAGNQVSVASLTLYAMRGEMPVVSQAKETDLTLADVQPPLRAETVDSTGASVWKGTMETSHIQIAKHLAPGDYFVRTYSHDGALLHEYGFHVRD